MASLVSSGQIDIHPSDRLPPAGEAGSDWYLGRMGLEQRIHFADEATPTWEAIRTQLSRVGETPALRLIDGLPAFPDETPEPGWKELRIATTAGMVSIRRQPGMLACVVWGNADPALAAAWARVVWACAVAGGGTIDSHGQPLTPDQFATSVGLTPK